MRLPVRAAIACLPDDTVVALLSDQDPVVGVDPLHGRCSVQTRNTQLPVPGPAALELLRRMFAHVIVDIGPGFSEPNLAALESAHNVLIVCTADRAGVRAVTECQRICRELLRLPGDPLQYLLNHPSPYPSLSAEQLEHALNARLIGSVPYGGETVARAALEGLPVVSRSPHSAVSRAIIGVAERMQAQLSEALQLATRRASTPQGAYAELTGAAPV